MRLENIKEREKKRNILKALFQSFKDIRERIREVVEMSAAMTLRKGHNSDNLRRSKRKCRLQRTSDVC